MPAAVTGIGLAWLMASNPHLRPVSTTSVAKPGRPMDRVSSPAAWADHTEFERHMGGVEAGVIRRTDEEDSAYHSRLDEARGKAIGLVKDAQDTAETFGKRVQDGLAVARRSVADAAQNLTDKASDTARQMTEAMGNAGDQLTRGTQAARQMGGDLLANLTDNPILLGAIGLAVGAILGALVPQSEQEQAALGDVGRRVREGAGEIAQDAVDRGATVARQVVDTARESAAGEGLAGKTVGHFVDEALKGNLASSVGEVARDVLKAGDEAIRKDGLGSSSGERPAPGSPDRS